MSQARLLACFLALMLSLSPSLCARWTPWEWVSSYLHPYDKQDTANPEAIAEQVISRSFSKVVQLEPHSGVPIAVLRGQYHNDLLQPDVATVFTADSSFYMPRLGDDSDDDKFDLDVAVMLARLTSISYCGSELHIMEWNCSRCGAVPSFTPTKVVYDEAWNLLGYVGWHENLKAIVVSFRGTDSKSWWNWVENMKFWTMNHSYPFAGSQGARVHAGFYGMWTKSKLGPQITAAVDALHKLHPEASLYATGHSMGAAIAQLSALDLKFSCNISDVKLYTFGAPRVGNMEFATLLNTLAKEHRRFTHNRDMVPSFPLQIMGFHHSARELWVVDVAAKRPLLSRLGYDPGPGPDTKYLDCDESGEDPTCHNSACYLGLCTSIADHLIYLGIHMYHDVDEC